MLPSEDTILRLRGGANRTASRGIHPVVRVCDQLRAERDQQVRDNHPVRVRAWNVQQ